MRYFVTGIRAVCPKTGELLTWHGPVVPGISYADAEAYCEKNGLGYCAIIGELKAVIPCKPGSMEPDFCGQIDYDNQN